MISELMQHDISVEELEDFAASVKTGFPTNINYRTCMYHVRGF